MNRLSRCMERPIMFGYICAVLTYIAVVVTVAAFKL